MRPTITSPYDGFDVFQICLNGHPITDICEEKPQLMKKFCPLCGSRTITACPSCNALIRGKDYRYATYMTKPPKFCDDCGQPFPWTISGLSEVKDFIDDSDQEASDKAELHKAFDNILVDSVKTPRAIERVKRYIDSLDRPSQEFVLSVVKVLATDAAKKSIMSHYTWFEG